ncbi:hydroxymyristoyl-ACP dehydratase [Christiangramia fulva]|uniref:Hydroxymyristoyl-ACP dehydratase n=1 Tax=Christiangramia fulva TaxID=2126553 RepID=A0A2R3Z888_9FLAO|nr:hydroxymyristoyl-ACP dehydratase [Christiangramia fulva]AVR46414.1 hydroxymyristoyl-ACP dehydratase [Christiangramia fulva]
MILQNFYELKETSFKEGKNHTRLSINKDHEIYKGHFPDRPVTPGVVLMLLFKEEAERISGKKLQMQRANNVKFMAVCDPTTDEELILETEAEEAGEYVKLKGIAKNNSGIVLKINSLYKIK